MGIDTLMYTSPAEFADNDPSVNTRHESKNVFQYES